MKMAVGDIITFLDYQAEKAFDEGKGTDASIYYAYADYIRGNYNYNIHRIKGAIATNLKFYNAVCPNSKEFEILKKIFCDCF